MTKKIPENSDQPIDKLDLKTVNRLRKRIATALKGITITAGLSLTAGHVAGKYTQGEYRERTGYRPETPLQTEKKPTEKEEQKEPEKKVIPENETWIEKAKREAEEKLEEAKRWARKEINEGPEKIEVIKEYQETVRQMRELKQKILETGDNIAYWLPFLIMFLATVKMARVAMTANKKIRDFIDPERMKKFDEIEQKTNEIIARVNFLSEKVRENGTMPAEIKTEVKNLTEEFSETSGVMNKEEIALKESA